MDGTTPIKEQDLPVVRVLNGEDNIQKRMFTKNKHTPNGVYLDVRAVALRDKNKKNAAVEVERIKQLFKEAGIVENIPMSDSIRMSHNDDDNRNSSKIIN